MSNTNDQFAQDINNSFRGHSSCLRLSTLCKQFLKGGIRSRHCKGRCNYFKQSWQTAEKKNDNEDNEDALKD